MLMCLMQKACSVRIWGRGEIEKKRGRGRQGGKEGGREEEKEEGRAWTPGAPETLVLKFLLSE